MYGKNDLDWEEFELSGKGRVGQVMSDIIICMSTIN